MVDVRGPTLFSQPLGFDHRRARLARRQRLDRVGHGELPPTLLAQQMLTGRSSQLTCYLRRNSRQASRT
jgi:hypothetical protein